MDFRVVIPANGFRACDNVAPHSLSDYPKGYMLNVHSSQARIIHMPKFKPGTAETNSGRNPILL